MFQLLRIGICRRRCISSHPPEFLEPRCARSVLASAVLEWIGAARVPASLLISNFWAGDAYLSVGLSSVVSSFAEIGHPELAEHAAANPALPADELGKILQSAAAPAP